MKCWCSPFWTNPNFVQCCCPTMSSSQIMHPKSRKTKSEPGRTHQSPRHAGGPETCRESQQVPHTLRSELLPKPGRGKQGLKANSKRSPTKPRFPSKRLPGECLRSWNYIQIGPDNPIFNSSQLSQAQLNLLNIQSSSWRTGLKLAPLLSLQIQSYAVRFTACHLFDANLHCIQVQNVWFFNLLANSSVSSNCCAKGLIDVY